MQYIWSLGYVNTVPTMEKAAKDSDLFHGGIIPRESRILVGVSGRQCAHDRMVIGASCYVHLELGWHFERFMTPITRLTLPTSG